MIRQSTLPLALRRSVKEAPPDCKVRPGWPCVRANWRSHLNFFEGVEFEVWTKGRAGHQAQTLTHRYSHTLPVSIWTCFAWTQLPQAVQRKDWQVSERQGLRKEREIVLQRVEYENLKLHNERSGRKWATGRWLTRQEPDAKPAN